MSLQYGLGGTRIRKIYGGEESGRKPLPPMALGKGSCQQKHEEGSNARKAMFESQIKVTSAKRLSNGPQVDSSRCLSQSEDYRFKKPTAAISVTRKPDQPTAKPIYRKAPAPTFSLEWKMPNTRHPDFATRKMTSQ